MAVALISLLLLVEAVQGRQSGSGLWVLEILLTFEKTEGSLLPNQEVGR